MTIQRWLERQTDEATEYRRILTEASARSHQHVFSKEFIIRMAAACDYDLSPEFWREWHRESKRFKAANRQRRIREIVHRMSMDAILSFVHVSDCFGRIGE
jgi:hypothetical protein